MKNINSPVHTFSPGSLRIHGFLTIAFCLLFCFTASVQAQSAKRRAASSHRKMLHAQAINYAKNYLVSKIEPGLPRQTFSRWFRNVVGRDERVKWSVGDCDGSGPRTEPRTGREEKCVVAETTESYIGATIFLWVGRFNNRFVPGKVRLRLAMLDNEGEGTEYPKSLRVLPKMWNEKFDKSI